MIMQHIIHHPYWGEWVRMISKGLHDHLQIYDMGQVSLVTLVSLGIFLSLPKGSYFFDPFLEEHL